MPLGRYWMVNQLRRVPAPPFMMRLPDRLGGFLYQCDQRDSVAREVCYNGQDEPQETQLMSGLLRPADVFVDVGANWGYFSLAAAHWVGPRGRVVAFEPEPRLYRMLVTNIAANDIAWIQTHPIAIAAGDGRMSFAAFREDAGNWGYREPWFTPARAISSARRAASTPHSTRRASAACGSSRSTSKAAKSECLPGCRRGWLPPSTTTSCSSAIPRCWPSGASPRTGS